MDSTSPDGRQTIGHGRPAIRLWTPPFLGASHPPDGEARARDAAAGVKSTTPEQTERDQWLIGTDRPSARGTGGALPRPTHRRWTEYPKGDESRAVAPRGGGD